MGRYGIVKLVGLLGLLGLVNLTGVWSARVVGWHFLQPEPYVRTLEITCAQPCWQGIIVGSTDFEEDFEPPVTPQFHIRVRTNLRNIINRLTLISTNHLTLGDLVIIWGEPSHVDVRRGVTSGGAVRLQARLYFQDGLVIAYIALPINQLHVAHISPTMHVFQIEYYAPSPQGNIVPIGTSRWQGFGTHYSPDR